MTRSYSLAYLTAPDLPPPDAMSLAADFGYSHIGLRMLPAMSGGHYWPLMTDTALLAATIARSKALAVGVYDVEIIWLTPEFDIEAYRRFFEVAAALGAKAMLVGGADPDATRLTNSFANLCAAARPYGLTADLEFMPWSTVPDARAASKIVAAAAQPNAGLLVDALHFARSGSTLADIGAMPLEWLHYVQICDAPAAAPATTDGLIHAARRERLLPGEGGLPLSAVFAALPQHVPVSIELPNERSFAALGSREWARRALAATKAVLESAQT